MKKELEWLDKLLDKLADKHDELKDKVAENQNRSSK